MAADVELLPLPEDYDQNPAGNAEVQDYARANVEARTEALRAELREAWSAVDSKSGWEWKKRAEQAEARSERLAEALRGMVENACAACDVLPNGTHRIDATEQEWAAHVAATDKAIAALHPTAAKEDGRD